MTAERPEPWEQQAKESAPAFEAFVKYRDLGPARSHAKVAKELGKSTQLMSRWSRSHSWILRASAWDKEQDRIYVAELSTSRREMAKRHARIAQAAQAKVVARLQTLEPSALSPSELIRWLEITSKVERAALGEPDRIQVSGGAADPGVEAAGAMTDEERRTRMEMLRRELNSRLGQEEGVPA